MCRDKECTIVQSSNIPSLFRDLATQMRPLACYTNVIIQLNNVKKILKHISLSFLVINYITQNKVLHNNIEHLNEFLYQIYFNKMSNTSNKT